MQENELLLWGISKELRRNIIVGFIVLELAAIGWLVTDNVRLQREKDSLSAEIVKCKEDYAEAFDSFRREQVEKLEKALERQQKIEDALRNANEKIKRRR